MTFDKAEHQQIVAQLIATATFPGAMLEKALELKEAVAHATITSTDAPVLAVVRDEPAA